MIIENPLIIVRREGEHGMVTHCFLDQMTYEEGALLVKGLVRHLENTYKRQPNELLEHLYAERNVELICDKFN